MIESRMQGAALVSPESERELEAERLLKQALDALELTEDELEEMKSTCPEKQAIAWLLKK